MNGGPRIGLFLCNGGQLLSSALNFENLKSLGKSLDQVVLVQEMGKMCSPEGIGLLKKAIEERKLDSMVLAACNLTQSQKSLKGLLAEEGLDLDAVELVDLRELSTWVKKDKKLADRKAGQSMLQSIEKLVKRDELHLQDVPVSGDVLVIGHGWTALKAASELAALGRKVRLVCDEKSFGDKRESAGYTDETAAVLDRLLEDVAKNPNIEKLLPSRVLELDGFAGGYHLVIRDTNSVHREFRVGGLVLAPEPQLRSNFNAWGVAPSDKVLPLKELEGLLRSDGYLKQLQESTQTGSGQAVFLVGFTHTSSPLSQKRVFRAAQKMAESGHIRPLVLLDHFKVADEGLEALAIQAREAGVLFSKVTDQKPVIDQTGGNLAVSFYEEVLDQDITVKPDIIVLEEETLARENAPRLAKIMGLKTDNAGFFQADNVYNLPIFTNRTGILTVGPARGPVSLDEGFQEAREAALHLHELLGEGHRTIASDRVKLDKKKCTICLTCYRLCPHHAISVVNRRPVFSDLACKACGICASECPMDAIQIHNFTDNQIRAEVKTIATGLNGEADKEFIPSIVAFCCKNSAVEAAKLASYRRLKLPVGLEIVEVGCAGKIDMDYVLTAFKDGADGVMVLSCHPESCKSLDGSTMAKWRVDQLHEYLAETGLEPERLVYGGLAAGMSQEFVRKAAELEAKLVDLGESPVRKAVRFKKIA